MHTPAYANTNQHELHTIAKSNLIASNSQNVQKTTVPKKPTKSSKQDEIKSKLSVAEAHSMRLESRGGSGGGRTQRAPPPPKIGKKI